MKLKRLFLIEIASLAIAVVVVMFFVEGSPFLASSRPDSSADVYSQQEIARGNVTLTRGQRVGAYFNYSTYEPSILVLELSFLSWQTQGNLSIFCNRRLAATLSAFPQRPTSSLTIVSLSGLDWVDTPTLPAISARNGVFFVSDTTTGYEGTFSYVLYLRGSR